MTEAYPSSTSFFINAPSLAIKSGVRISMLNTAEPATAAKRARPAMENVFFGLYFMSFTPFWLLYRKKLREKRIFARF